MFILSNRLSCPFEETKMKPDGFSSNGSSGEEDHIVQQQKVYPFGENKRHVQVIQTKEGSALLRSDIHGKESACSRRENAELVVKTTNGTEIPKNLQHSGIFGLVLSRHLKFQKLNVSAMKKKPQG